MRKVFGLFLVLALAVSVVCVTGIGYADTPESDNIHNVFEFGGPAGTTPMTEIIKVRWRRAEKSSQAGSTAESIASGDVLVWDTNSADGYTISQCITDTDAATSYAGVAVTTFETAEHTTVLGVGRNIGWMAIRGYCLAKVDTSAATTGRILTPNGATLTAAFGTKRDVSSANPGSPDCGVLLRDDSSDGIMPVWLR